MSAEDWGPCSFCKVPLSRANASRLRSGAVMHVGCKGLQKEPSEPVGIVVTAPRGFPAALREEIALGQAAKDRLSALAAGLPDEVMPRAVRRSRGGPPGGVTGSGPVTVKVEGPPFGSPLVQASGPTDYEALGRERYWDTSPAMREAQLPGIVAQLRPGTPQEDRRFADGWLAEHARAKADEQRMSAATSAGPLNGLLCSVCREPQFDTPSGEVCKNGHGGAEGVPPPPARKERRRVSLRDPLTQEQRDAFVMVGTRGLAAALPPAEAEELRRRLAAEVARAAAEPKEDVVLQALHVAGGANGIGVGEVRPEAAPLACEACWMPVALCACACASCGGMCGARCLSGGPGKATRPAPAPDLIRSIVESGRVSGARALLDRLPDHPALRGWREVLAPPVVSTSTGTRPNIDVRSPAGVVPAEPDGTLLRVLVGRDEAGKLAVTEPGPDGAEAARVGEWDPAGPFGDGKLIYSKREGLKGVLALLAWCFRLWDSEVVTLAPLAKAEPPAAPEPVHMLVPGFPGHACCGWPVEAPKPAVPPSRGKRARDGKPAVPASPGRPATPGTPVTTDRSKATCPECMEVYEDAERLASRIEELKPEPTPEEQEVAEEVAERRAEAKARADRDLAQLRILEQEKARAGAPPSPRPDGELVHLFDGFPAAGTRTRCGIATSRKFEALTSGKVELFAVPFLAGHPRCCPACAALPQPPNARSYGAFVPPDCVVPEGKIGA